MNWYKTAKRKKCSGWIAIRFKKTDAIKIQNWGKKHILEDMLYNKQKEQGKPTDFGREIDTHVTVLYGVCTNNPDIIENIVKGFKNIKIELKNVSFFKHPEGYEPLIIKVESKDLEEIHKKIKEELNVEMTYNEYKPHCTIAYLKKGEAMKFVGDKSFSGTKLSFDKIVFVNSYDEESIISLK